MSEREKKVKEEKEVSKRVAYDVKGTWTGKRSRCTSRTHGSTEGTSDGRSHLWSESKSAGFN